MRLRSAGPESAFIAAGKVNAESPLSRTLACRQDARRLLVRDANGQGLVYLYSRDSEAEAMQAKVLDGGRSAAHRHQCREAAGTVLEARGLMWAARQGESARPRRFPRRTRVNHLDDAALARCTALIANPCAATTAIERMAARLLASVPARKIIRARPVKAAKDAVS
jgi:hypothetical protein